MQAFLFQLLSPCFICFFLMFIGILIGNVSIFRFRLGLAGVLISAIVYGGITTLVSKTFSAEIYHYFYSNDMQVICKCLSDIGMALFLSVIALSAGEFSKTAFSKVSRMAFGAGVLIVFLGSCTIVPFMFVNFDPTNAYLLGIFSGGMTSTPAFAIARECYNGDSAVAAGYGTAYCFGLLSVLLFVQLMSRHSCNSSINLQIPANHFSKAVSAISDDKKLELLAIVILTGFFIGKLSIGDFYLGSTGGIMIMGFLIGRIYTKKNGVLPNFSIVRSLGLALFFVGTGIPAGVSFLEGFCWQGFFPSLLIPVFAITVGYIFLRTVFKFSKAQSLTIICGGMTSTPAIVLLREEQEDTDLSLYTAAYLGALLSLIIFTKILFSILERR